MLHAVVLGIHVVVGAAGVVLGPLTIAGLARRRVDRTVPANRAAVLGVCVTALGLVASDPRPVWWLVPVAAGTYAFVWLGHRGASSTPTSWPAAVRGYGGAYIALWTAILVVSVESSVITWLLPTLIGTPIVEWLAFRVHAARRVLT